MWQAIANYRDLWLQLPSRIEGTTVDSVANLLQYPILATCRPQDSFSAAAGVEADAQPPNAAPSATIPRIRIFDYLPRPRRIVSQPKGESKGHFGVWFGARRATMVDAT